MKWYVFKKDDPSTYPEIDCPMLVFKNFDDDYLFARSHWDNVAKCFVGDGASAWNECYYAYICYVPSGHKVHQTLRCLNDKNCKFGCNDDGYCMYDFCECEQQVVRNEYEVMREWVWKKFT